MTTSHLKQCIELEQQFDFLKDLVASVPDMQGDGEDNHMDGDKGPRRGRKPGSSNRKNGGMGSKGKDKKLSGTDSEQEDESEDTDTDGEEETPQAPPQASHPPAHFQRALWPSHPSTSFPTRSTDQEPWWAGQQLTEGRCWRPQFCQGRTRGADGRKAGQSGGGPEPAGASAAGRQPVSLCCVTLGRFPPFSEWPLPVSLMETTLLTLGCCRGTDGTSNRNKS
ncbi:dr1-associated corepressor isoform X2 [Hippopotamus amphibius kiboko]|nr:dr1-associated corepressor isoform X2 [Hippopotamus amphibius kiboko]